MSQRKFLMNYGAILGLLLVLVAVLQRAMGIIDLENPTLVLTVNTFLIAAVLLFSIQKYRDLINNGFISYSQSVKVGVSITVFSSIIFGFWKIVLINYIDTDYSTLAIQKQQQMILELDNTMPGFIDNIDQKLDDIENNLSSQYRPHTIMINEIISKAIGGLILSLIIAFFTTKKNPEILI